MKNKTLARIIAVILCILAVCACGCAPQPSAVTTDTETAEPVIPEKTAADIVSDMIEDIISGKVTEEERADAAEKAYIAYYALAEEERASVKNADKFPKLRAEAAKLYVTKEYGDKRIDHSKIQIGTYWVRLSDPEHLKDIKDCGIDYVWQPPGDRQSLDNYYNAGLGIMEYIAELGALPWLGEPDADGYEAFLGDIEIDHPAVWGFYQCDEPTASLFPTLEAHGNVLKKYLPESTHVIDLPPIDSVNSTTYNNYVEYIKNFTENTSCEQIVYNNYMFYYSLSTALDNMWVVSDAADATGRDYWIIVGVSNTNKAFTEKQLIAQAYAALAYGCVNISYCCWTADKDSWGTVKVLDANGEKTEVYDSLKSAVADIKSFSPVYMQYKHKGSTILIGENFIHADLDTLKDRQSVRNFDSVNFSKIRSMDIGEAEFAIVGGFEKKIGNGEAFFLLNCTNPFYKNSASSTVTFTVDDSVKQVVAYVKGIPTVLTAENGVYTVTASDADAVFVTVE